MQSGNYDIKSKARQIVCIKMFVNKCIYKAPTWISFLAKKKVHETEKKNSKNYTKTMCISTFH